MSMEDLAAITMVQPAVSEADEHAPSTPLPSNTSTPRCRSQLGSRLSLRLTGFETLLGQLRAQYVTEVSELHAHLTEAHAQITRLTLVRDDMEEEMEKIRSENEDLLQDLHLKEVRQSKSSRVSLGEQLMTCSMESVPSSQKTFPTHVNAAMDSCEAKRHEQLPTVNADQVLEVMDDERASIASLEALFKETDMRKGVLAADEYASESDSEIERRLKRLPRVERARIWFQNDYEMLMALSLSLYVVWMAFELQFYGVISGYDLGVYDFRVPVEEIPSWDSVFQVGDACFTAFYGMDVFWHHCLNYVDVAVALASTAQLLLTNMPINPVLFRLLRLGKLARAIRMLHMTSIFQKVKKLFQTMDASGNGAINLQEFAKLVQSPKLKFWMGQLELEYHDMLSLFEFLDNGDGEITLILGRWEWCCISSWSLVGPEHNVKSTTVQQIFNASSYSHIKSSRRSCRSSHRSRSEFAGIIPEICPLVRKEVRLARQRQQVIDFLKYHKFNPLDVDDPKVSCCGLFRSYPLQTAARKQDWEIVYLLLLFGADPCKTNSYGKNTYDYIESKSMRVAMQDLHGKFARKPTSLVRSDEFLQQFLEGA
eukprot:g13337.t1